MALKDLKEALGNTRKADTTHVRKHFQAYTARPCEYGSVKYERANYLRPTGGEAHTEPTAADFERLRVYLRAARGHIDDVLQSMELHQAQDPNLEDADGMQRAAYAIDLDTKPGSPHPASHLPHVAPACASLMMAIEQAVACGLLPEDPGTPWAQPALALERYGVQAPVCHDSCQHDDLLGFAQREAMPMAPLKQAIADGAADSYTRALEQYACDHENGGGPVVPQPSPYGGRW